MKKIAAVLVICGMLVAISTSTGEAILGDANGDGSINVYDSIYLLNYLFKSGSAPPNPIDADVDGSPGINMGDVLQLLGYLFSSCDLLPYTGVSVKVSSKIRCGSTPDCSR